MMLSLSMFETLPDEILMIIFSYCNDIYSLCRSFFGLNQRLNHILVDTCLHVFTDLLHIDVNDSDINSNLFCEIYHQCLSVKTTENDKQFHEFLHSFISFYMKEKYKQSTDEFQSSLKLFQSRRMHLTENEIDSLDNELRRAFTSVSTDLDSYRAWEPKTFFPELIMNMKQIKSLILNQGASLKFDEQEFNFAMTVNKCFISKANFTKYDDSRFINPLIDMFKAILISNPLLLGRRDYTNHYAKACSTYYFLIYSIYQLKYFVDARYEPDHHMKIHWYKAEVNLFLFTLNYLSGEESRSEDCLFDVLDKIKLIVPSNSDNIFIRTSQIEILKIVLQKYNRKDVTTCDRYHLFPTILYNLFETNQLDIVRLIYKESKNVQCLFERLKTSEKIVDIMTANREKKELLKMFLNDEQLRTWFIDTDLLYILLKKKQCKLIKHLLKLSPLLIHQLDQDGNDALLYLCLNVRGCRHRLIEFLIKMGSHLSRANSTKMTFFNALQMTRNKKLLNKLIEHEIIEIDYVSADVKLINRVNTFD